MHFVVRKVEVFIRIICKSSAGRRMSRRVSCSPFCIIGFGTACPWCQEVYSGASQLVQFTVRDPDVIDPCRRLLCPALIRISVYVHHNTAARFSDIASWSSETMDLQVIEVKVFQISHILRAHADTAAVNVCILRHTCIVRIIEFKITHFPVFLVIELDHMVDLRSYHRLARAHQIRDRPRISRL